MLKNNMVAMDAQQNQENNLKDFMQREQKLKMGKGMHFFTKMTIIRLKNNDLFVHSPIKLDEQMIKDIKSFGNVKYIVSPNLFHHLFAGQCKEQFPDALLFGADGLQEKRADLKFDYILKGVSKQDESYQQPPWQDEIDDFLIESAPKINETVFYHKASKSLICTEFIMHMTKDYTNKFNCCQRCMLGCFGFKFNQVIGAKRMLYTKNNKKQLKADIEKILAWDIQQIVPTHGNAVTGGDIKNIIIQTWKEAMLK